MNLDSLLAGIFQIRVPEHIMQELMAEQGEEIVEDEKNTPIKVLTD